MIFIGIVCAGFSIVLVGISLLIYFRTKKRVGESQSWSVVRGYITESYVGYEFKTDIDDRSHRVYHPELRYTYQVLGREYIGDKILFRQKATYGARKKAQKFLVRYPVGQEVAVYYDPNNPADAVLDRKMPSFWH